MGLLLPNKKIKKIVGENKLFEKLFLSGELEVELVDFTKECFLLKLKKVFHLMK